MKKLLLIFIALLFVSFVSGELININVNVHKISKQVHPGDEVFAQISLVNVAMNKDDVTLEYGIVDKNGNIIDKESETILMTTRIDRVRSLELPEDIRKGIYLFVVKITYKEKEIGIASDQFEVIEIEKPAVISNNRFLYIIIIIIVFFIFFMIYEYIKFKQIEKLIKKVNERNMKKCLK